MKPNSREMAAIVAARNTMPKKPKPATAGEKIMRDVIMNRIGDRLGNPIVARRIDRAITRAVRKERDRCAAWVQLVEEGKIGAEAARIAIGWGEVVAETYDPIAREADAAIARAERRMLA